MAKRKITNVQTTIYKTSVKSFANIDRPNRICLFSSKSDDFGLVLESTILSSVNYGHHVRFVFFNSRFDV
jgi:hypothetical protein